MKHSIDVLVTPWIYKNYFCYRLPCNIHFFVFMVSNTPYKKVTRAQFAFAALYYIKISGLYANGFQQGSALDRVLSLNLVLQLILLRLSLSCRVMPVHGLNATILVIFRCLEVEIQINERLFHYYPEWKICHVSLSLAVVKCVS